MASSSLTLAIAFALASGCAGGGFGGLGGSKEGKGKASGASKEETAGDEGEDGEDTEADAPVEVAGSFLTVACAPTATKPSHMPAGDYKAYGCAVIDKKTKLFYPEATVNNVVFGFHEGEEQVVPLVDAPAGGPWHVYTYVETAKAELLKSVRGYATVKEKTFGTVNVSLDDYDPEQLVQTTEDEAKNPAENGLPLKIVATYPSDQIGGAEKSIDNAPQTIWNVPGASGPQRVWVIYDLGGVFHVKTLSYDLCAVAPDEGRVQGSDEVTHLGLGTLKDDVKIGEIYHGDSKVQTWEVDDKVRPLRFVKIEMEEGTAAGSVCLNSVRVFGAPATSVKP